MQNEDLLSSTVLSGQLGRKRGCLIVVTCDEMEPACDSDARCRDCADVQLLRGSWVEPSVVVRAPAGAADPGSPLLWG